MGFWDQLFGPKRRPELGPLRPVQDNRPTREPTAAKNAARRSIVWRPGAESFPLKAVGESNYQPALSKICGGHNRDGHELEVVAHLVPEPNNKYDPNAVMVRVRGERVGYIPREQAVRINQALADAGIGAEGVDCAAKINGGWRTNQHDAGHFGVCLAIPTRGPISFS